MPLCPRARCTASCRGGAHATGGIGASSSRRRPRPPDRPAAPFAFAGGLNTLDARQRHACAPGARGRRPGPRRHRAPHDRRRQPPFPITSAGARPWTQLRGPVRLRVRPWGAKAAMSLPPRRPPPSRRPPAAVPFPGTRRARTGQARARGRRHLGRRPRRRPAIPVRRRGKPRASGADAEAEPSRRPHPSCGSSQSVAAGQDGDRVRALEGPRAGRPARVEFLVDGTCAAPTSPRPTRSAGTPPPRRRARIG